MPVDDSKTKADRQGLVMVITGNGKGKSTAAFGQALRAAGQGWKVCVVQFMKGRAYGEVLAVKKYLPEVQIYQFGLDSFVMRDNPAPVDKELALQGFAKAAEIVQSNSFDLVVMDEINVAVDFGLIPEESVVNLVKQKPPQLVLILTGRYAAEKIKELADTVSEITEVKHHYQSGIKDQPGVEY
ncbi:MAG: cob(I)yrinic acid a,c-diamide adenosyltransferase [Syntrophomonadaceae bacterium]|jgi:cob(I)alamin adenosyltransferase|nr:cob(I)yrinic acid a,c-diamide adenosyltransferase [Syntrophomonadaceae bacterium]